MKILKTYIIYLATNIKNGKVYVGQTLRKLQTRIAEHYLDAKNGIKTTYFISAIKKYGPENFVWKEIDRAFTEKAANALEIHYIKYYKSQDSKLGYNLTKGGSSCRWTQEDKDKHSVNMKRLAPSKSKKHSETIRKKIENGEWSSPFLDKNHSQESIDKMRQSHLNKKPANCKPVRCIETGEIYHSAAEASRINKLNRRGLDHCLNKKSKSCGGLHWEYIGEQERQQCIRRKIKCITTGEIFNSIREVSRLFSINRLTIKMMCRGERKTPIQGLVFEYTE